MKKTILMGIALAFAATSFAQKKGAKPLNDKGPYLRAGLGYAFPHAGSLYKGSITQSGSTAAFDLKKGSLGEGLSGVIAGGYKFTRTIALELGIGVGIAPKKQTSNTIYESGYGQRTTVEQYARIPVYLMPAVVISSGNNWLEPYARAGLMVPVAGKMIADETSQYPGPTGSSDLFFARTEIKLRTGVGLQGALGLKYHINNKTSLWLEAAGVSQHLYLKHSELTQATLNGENVLDGYTTSERIVNYEFNYTQTSPEPTNLPSTQAAVPVSFSNIGVNFGIALQF